MMPKYLPEGLLLKRRENEELTASLQGLEKARENGTILEGIALLCNSNLDLKVNLGGIEGIIPKEEVSFSDGKKEKDIAVISRVGKPVCFKISEFRRNENGKIYALLSRKAAQMECYEQYLRFLKPGDIIPSKVTHSEAFGTFLDIGCGVISLMSIDCISVSRIAHPKDRLTNGRFIRAVVKMNDLPNKRIYMTMKELFGTWEENAARYEVGQTVTGIIRSIEDYGIFVELTPNLAGLAEYKEGVTVGSTAAVFIKNIIPERMKIKLVLIDAYENGRTPPTETEYFIPENVTHLNSWCYSPKNCYKQIETIFS